jgi:hypothetical protein
MAFQFRPVFYGFWSPLSLKKNVLCFEIYVKQIFTSIVQNLAALRNLCFMFYS